MRDIILLTLSNDFPFLTQFTKAWSPVCHSAEHDAGTAFCDGSTLSYYKSYKNSNSDYFFNKQWTSRDEIKQFWQMSSLIILIKQEQGTSVTLEILRCWWIDKDVWSATVCCLVSVFMFYILKSLNLAFNAVLLAFYGEQRVKFILPSFEMSWFACCNQDVLSIIQPDDTLRLASF